MIYKNIKEAIFIDRPNRFIANIEIDGQKQICHVKNTGRCRELLIPGATVYVQQFPEGSRKTFYDLIGVVKSAKMINIDSQAPNKVFGEWLRASNQFKDIIKIKPESKYKNSRFDFYVETAKEKILIEVKGVTLEEDNVVLFPDAPTERGVKHICELIECLEQGYKAYVVFVIQMKGVTYFMPNNKIHPEFGRALKLAQSRGVKILAYDCNVAKDKIEISERVEVKL